ncbi:MAG: PASTA domain-containing protein [Coriobacteriia bacterium]|nr:PASTA domain-containing protein [Coriobacteriia bacterium]
MKAEKDIKKPLDVDEGNPEEGINGNGEVGTAELEQVVADQAARAAAAKIEDSSSEVSDKAPAEDDAALSDQLQGLRGELKSTLPEPEKFLSFEAAVADRESSEEDEQSPGRFPNSPRFLLRFGIIALAVSLVIVGGLVLFLRVEMPSLVGQTSVEASETLVDLGLDFELFEEEVPGTPAGQVLSTTPAAGEYVMRGTTVVVRVAVDTDLVAVPDLRGMSLDEAKEALTALRLDAETVYTFDGAVPAGNIVGFLPVINTQIPAGTPVTILVSAGVFEASLDVPRVIGLTEEAARTVLIEAGFNPVMYYAATTRGEIDHVVSQTPGEGNTVSPGSPILVMVSTGNSTTDHPIPDVSEERRAEAEIILEQAGFEPEPFSIVDAGVDAGTVISQMPPAQDALLRSGDPVGLLVSAGANSAAEVPSVLGLDEESARDTLRGVGLNAVFIFDPVLAGSSADDVSPEVRGDIVTQQFPAGGSQYHIGLPVLVFLSAQD